ncbi:MAG: Fic family protein [Synergistaceae bacterium]|jgi:Fic family protein|nr:Fic family protein [Synergistaceae bacterium]
MDTYNITQKLLENITSIERFYGQLEALRLPQNLQLNLERNNFIESSYVSNSIEGNPLSLPEVTNLLLDERVPANRSEREIKNYFDSLKSLSLIALNSFDVETILKLHRDLMRGLDEEIAGNIRNVRVVVGNRVRDKGKIKIKVKHEPPFHDAQNIRNALEELVRWINEAPDLPILKIGVFHHQYVYLHPFIDGNGRTVRLLTALLFLRSGYRINKYFVLDDYYDIDRLGYSDALHSADSGNATSWLEYFTDGVKYSLGSALAKAQNALRTLGVRQQPTPKEKIVMDMFTNGRELVTAQVADELALSRQQAHRLLSRLVEKGLLEKHGATKKSYYRLKY